jgi:hypothetical protein
MNLPHTFARYAASDSLRDQQTALLFMAASKSNRAESVGRAIERIYKAAASVRPLGFAARGEGVPPLRVVNMLSAETLAEEYLYDLRCKNQIARTLREVATRFGGLDDLRGQITDETARKVWGIGPKIGGWIGCVFGGEDNAVLDVHILDFLRAAGVPDVPSQTPQDPDEYGTLEMMTI